MMTSLVTSNIKHHVNRNEAEKQLLKYQKLFTERQKEKLWLHQHGINLEIYEQFKMRDEKRWKIVGNQTSERINVAIEVKELENEYIKTFNKHLIDPDINYKSECQQKLNDYLSTTDETPKIKVPIHLVEEVQK